MKNILTNEFQDFNRKGFNNALLSLFLLSLVLTPIDNFPYFGGILGELSVRGPVYPFIPIILIIGVYSIVNKKIYINFTIEKALILMFILWTTVSAILNGSSILTNNFKGRVGMEKLLLQVMVVGFMIVIMYCTEFIVSVKKIKLQTIRKYIAISFIFVAIYAFLEILQMYYIVDVKYWLKGISHFVHSFDRGLLYGNRLRGLSGEASFFGMYAAFAFPWIVSYIFTEKSKVKKGFFAVASIYFLFLVYLTKSRTAYGLAFAEIGLVFLGVALFNKSKKNKIVALVIVLCSFISISLFGKFNDYMTNRMINNPEFMADENDAYDFNMSISGLTGSLASKTNYSNIARFGLQKSAIKIGNDNPILGVGLGQFGFYADSYLSDDTRVSNEIQRWTDGSRTDYWPPAFALYPRIIAEQGYVGLAIWGVLVLVLVLKLLRLIINKRDNLLEIFMLITFGGVLVSFLNVDTYGLPQFWILIGVIMAYTNKNNIHFHN